MHIAEASALTTLTCGRIRPPFSRRRHYLRDTVPPRLLGEALNERAVEEAAEDGDQQEEPHPEPGKMVAPMRPCWPNCSWPVASQVRAKTATEIRPQRGPLSPRPRVPCRRAPGERHAATLRPP